MNIRDKDFIFVLISVIKKTHRFPSQEGGGGTVSVAAIPGLGAGG